MSPSRSQDKETRVACDLIWGIRISDELYLGWTGLIMIGTDIHHGLFSDKETGVTC